MKAKDTVMSQDVQTGWLDGHTVGHAIEHQAEISFKAGGELGYKRGLAMKPKGLLRWLNKSVQKN